MVLVTPKSISGSGGSQLVRICGDGSKNQSNQLINIQQSMNLSQSIQIIQPNCLINGQNLVCNH